MEQVEVSLPGGGVVSALRIQDLPAEHILAFMGMPPEIKGPMSVKLLQLALGVEGSSVLEGMTFGELEHVLNQWMQLSGDSESEDPDGRGLGLDWTGLSL